MQYLFSIQYFTNMKTTGKTEIYHKTKTNQFDMYLYSNHLPELKGNLTATRISRHCLPKEYIRKKGLKRYKIYCNLCDENEMALNGTDQHVMVDCNNKEIVKLREQIKSNLIKVNYQYTQFSIQSIINIRLLANDISTNCYFAIFSQNVFHSLNLYTNRTSVPPWNEGNGGINLIIIGWMIFWSVADLLHDIQFSTL